MFYLTKHSTHVIYGYMVKDQRKAERKQAAATTRTTFRLAARALLYHPINRFQPVLHDWCNKGRGMYYPVCGMMHIKEPLLLIGKSSPCGGSGFALLLSEWSFTIMSDAI